jgi:hypothetical protein
MTIQNHGEPVEEKFGRWYDDFKGMIERGVIKKRNEEYAGWSIPAWWFQLQCGRYAAKGQETGKIPEFVVIVTDEEGQIVDPTTYRVWIRGFRSHESFCEDFPPIQFP